MRHSEPAVELGEPLLPGSRAARRFERLFDGRKRHIGGYRDGGTGLTHERLDFWAEYFGDWLTSANPEGGSGGLALSQGVRK